MKIRLEKERRDSLVKAIREYFKRELDEEMGNLQAGFLLDFFLERLGPPIYNQAIHDAQAYMQAKLIEVEDVLYQAEVRPKSSGTSVAD